MDINQITIGDARNIASIFNATQIADSGPWKVGQPYQIRTVTFTYTGRLVAVYPQELVLTDAAWIADTGRFAQACETGDYSEIEPFKKGSDVIIGRGSIVDASIAQKLNLSQK